MSSYFPLIEHSNFTLDIEESSSKYNLEIVYGIDEGTGDFLTVHSQLTNETLQVLKNLFNGEIGDVAIFSTFKTKTIFTITGIDEVEIEHFFNGLPDLTVKLKESFDLYKLNKNLRHVIEDHFNGLF